MLGSEFYDYFIDHIFKRTDKSDEVYESITDTVRDIKDKHTFESFKKVSSALTITTLGEYKIAVPSDFGILVGDLRGVYTTNNEGWNLDKISKEEYDRLLPYPSSDYIGTGKPTKYCIYGGYFYLWTIPDSVSYQYYCNYGYDDLAEITSATADVPFSNKYREMVCFGTAYRAFRDIQHDDEAKKWKELYEAEISKCFGKENRNTQAPVIQKYHGF